MKQPTESAVVIPILLALLAAIAPHAPGLPLWINLWCLSMWGYMLVRLKTGWPLPGKRIRYTLVIVGLAGLLATFRVRLGSDAFVGLMAVMAAIKPLEMASHRHRMITLLLTYFIIITSLFRSESLWIISYMFVSVFITTIALVRINHPGGRFKTGAGLAGRILAQAIPLTVLLFLLFPRLQEGVVGVRDTRAGVSGFSEALSPGSISRMSKDRSLAFRAEFNEDLPPADDLYWRGVVFEEFNGNTWRPARHPAGAFAGSATETEGFSHTIILEPHNSRWLMALDRPVTAPDRTFFTAARTIRSFVPVGKRKTYRVVSVPGSGIKNGPPPSPVSIGTRNNPRSRDLARDLTRDSPGPRAKLDRILAFFKGNGFTYTLDPPLAPGNPIDSFLFENKAGYCEHYAAALAFLLNAIDIPARIVGGYLGAELNPYGNYLTVRQSLAHAWVEVYLPETGWTRVDPTLAVSPDRLSRYPDGSRAYAENLAAGTAFLQKVTLFLDAVNLRWESWFTGYSYVGQKALLEKLGFGNRLNALRVFAILLVITSGVLLLAAFLFWWARHWGERGKDPVREAYLLFCRRMGRIGLPRAPDQGPGDYARAIGAKRPDLAAQAAAITDLYIRLRYQKVKDNRLLTPFKDKVKKFHPKPLRR